MVAVQNLKGEGGYHSVRSLTVLVEIWSDKEWWPWTGVSLYFDLNYPHLLKRSNGIYIYIYIMETQLTSFKNYKPLWVLTPKLGLIILHWQKSFGIQFLTLKYTSNANANSSYKKILVVLHVSHINVVVC